MRGRHRPRNAVAVAQVDRSRKGSAPRRARQRAMQLLVDPRSRRSGVRRAPRQLGELALRASRARARGCRRARCGAPSDAAQRAHHAQVGRRAARSMKPARVLFTLGASAELRCASRLRQREVVEEDLHELFARQREDEVVLALAVAAPAVAAAAAAAALRPLDAVAARRIPGCPACTNSRVAAVAVAERRLGDVLLRHADCRRPAPCRGCRSPTIFLTAALDLLLVAAQEALAVDARSCPARGSVDRSAEACVDLPSSPADHDDLRTRRYHSASRRTCFSRVALRDHAGDEVLVLLRCSSALTPWR